MKGKLYYQDPYIKNFSTKLVIQEKDESGNWYVVLEETAFYPTGGGQPCDLGLLNNESIINVEEINGEIRHYLNKPILVENKKIEGSIDWERRFDHMQQHSGQHILSAAFEELFQFKTVSFHLGKDYCSVDLDIEELSEEQASKTEELANQIILEGRPIISKWVTKGELSQYTLRKELSVDDNIRLVIIPDFDYNGCGGTHPASTSQVGVLKILNWERQAKKIRVYFVCGNRVILQLHKKNKVIIELSKSLSSSEEDMVESVSKLLENYKQVGKTLDEAKENLLQYEAKELASQAFELMEESIIQKVFENRPIQELQKLARFASSFCSYSLVFLVSKNDNRIQFVCACGSDYELSMKQLASAVLPIINGKGGGNDKMAQGGGESELTGEQVINHLIEQIRVLKTSQN